MLYHSNSTGPDPNAFKIALKKSLNIALASTKAMKICVQMKSQLRGGTIEEAMGEDFVKDLIKQDISALGVTIKLETEKMTNNTQMIILAPHVNQNYLDKLILKNGDAPVVYIPWTKEELNQYLAKYPNSTPI